jgi:hypothetical protein
MTRPRPELGFSSRPGTVLRSHRTLPIAGWWCPDHGQASSGPARATASARSRGRGRISSTAGHGRMRQPRRQPAASSPGRGGRVAGRGPARPPGAHGSGRSGQAEHRAGPGNGREIGGLGRGERPAVRVPGRDLVPPRPLEKDQGVGHDETEDSAGREKKGRSRTEAIPRSSGPSVRARALNQSESRRRGDGLIFVGAIHESPSCTSTKSGRFVNRPYTREDIFFGKFRGRL